MKENEPNGVSNYTVSRWENDSWIWCGDGNILDGTTAQLPDEVSEFADAGSVGQLKIDGDVYRIAEVQS